MQEGSQSAGLAGGETQKRAEMVQATLAEHGLYHDPNQEDATESSNRSLERSGRQRNAKVTEIAPTLEFKWSRNFTSGTSSSVG